MLNRYKIRKVLELIAAGVPFRRIANETKIARGTIQSIARGKHPSFRHPVLCDVETKERTGEVGYCERCHVSVELPCLACVARDYLRNGSVNEIQQTFEPLGVNLRPDDYERYLIIHSEKERKEREREDESIANFQKMEREEREREWECEANFKIGRIDAPFRKAA